MELKIGYRDILAVLLKGNFAFYVEYRRNDENVISSIKVNVKNEEGNILEHLFVYESFGVYTLVDKSVVKLDYEKMKAIAIESAQRSEAPIFVNYGTKLWK